MNTTEIENQAINKIKPNQGVDKEKEDWVECTLGDVCITTSGGTPRRSNKSYYEGKIPWVKSGELDKGVIYDSEEHITEEAIKNSSAKLFPKGTLLFALYGATIGKMAVLGVEAATNQAVCGIFESKAIKTSFLFNYLLFKKTKLIGQGIGGAQPNISQTILRQLEITLPPLPIQRAIVKKIEELFSSLDSGIADLKKAQEQLAIYRQAVLKKAFEGAYTQKKSEKKNIIINGLSSCIPENWRICQIGDIAKLQGGFAFKSGEYTNSGIPIVKIRNVHFQDIDWKDKTFVAKSRLEEFSAYSLNKGDVLIAMTRPVIKSLNNIKTVVVRDSDLPALLNQRVGRFIINGELDKDYLKYFIFTDFFKRRVLKESSSSQQPNISSTKIERFDFILPQTIQEQHQIVREIESRLSVCDKVEESISESLEKAEALRQSILKKAFEGKLLSDAEIEQCKAAKDYEPASVLLEKIKAEKKNK